MNEAHFPISILLRETIRKQTKLSTPVRIQNHMKVDKNILLMKVFLNSQCDTAKLFGGKYKSSSSRSQIFFVVGALKILHISQE